MNTSKFCLDFLLHFTKEPSQNAPNRSRIPTEGVQIGVKIRPM